MCCSKVNLPPTPTPPAPTPEEQALTASQNELYQENIALFKQQQAEQEATRKAFETATGMPYTDYLAQTAGQQATLNKSYMDRIQAGLAGDLPVNPALEMSLEQQGAALDEQYQKQLGPGYKTSDPYIRAKKQFDQMATGLRTAAQTGSITEGEQLGYASPTSLTSPSSQLTTISPIGNPSQTANLFDLYKFQQGMANQDALAGYNAQVNAAMAEAQSAGSMLSGGLGMLGNLGTGLFGAAGKAGSFGKLFGLSSSSPMSSGLYPG